MLAPEHRDQRAAISRGVDGSQAFAHCSFESAQTQGGQRIRLATARSQPTGGRIMSTKRDAYIAKMKVQLDELNAKMNEVEAKAKVVKEDVRVKYDEQLAKLRAQSKVAVAKFDQVKASGEDSWDAMVAEMDRVGEAFKHSFNYFKSQL
jgi:hypothetical protein